MEQIKKKMAVLRETLADAEERADKAEAELKEANERAANVSPCFNCRSLCFVWKPLAAACYHESRISENCCIARSSIYTVKYTAF